MQEAGGLVKRGHVAETVVKVMLNKCFFLPAAILFETTYLPAPVLPCSRQLAPRPVRRPPPSPSHRPCPFLPPAPAVPLAQQNAGTPPQSMLHSLERLVSHCLAGQARARGTGLYLLL
jgi:hypothetical protein